jgi:hypothetical protein
MFSTEFAYLPCAPVVALVLARARARGTRVPLHAQLQVARTSSTARRRNVRRTVANKSPGRPYTRSCDERLAWRYCLGRCDRRDDICYKPTYSPKPSAADDEAVLLWSFAVLR